MQTHIRMGHNDYNIFIKPKEDNYPWRNQPPLILSDEIYPFEIGKVPIDTNKRPRNDNDVDVPNHSENENIMKEKDKKEKLAEEIQEEYMEENDLHYNIMSGVPYDWYDSYDGK